MNPIHKYLHSLGLLLLVMIQSSCANDKTSLGEEPESTPVTLARWLDDAGRVEALPDQYIAETEILRVEAAGKVKNPWAGWSGQHDRVTTRGRFSYSSSSLDFAMLSPWPTSVLWPGCIIPGGSLRGLDTPTPIPLLGKRKPGHILLQLSDLEQEHEQSLTLQEEVQDMRESSVLQAQSRLLDRLTNSGKPTALQKEKIEIDPRKVYRGTPFTYSIRSVCSLEELAALSGLDVDRSIGALKRRLGTDFRQDKTYQLVHIYQPLYTLSYEPPQAGFSGILNDSVSVEDLKPFTGKGNPLCYISSVTYGHAYYLLVESSQSHLDLFRLLHSTLSSLSEGVLYYNKPELDELKVSLLRVGVVAEDQVTRGKFSDAVDVIHRGSKLGKRHIGSPISFTVKHVYDSSPVRMSNTLKYSYDKVELVPKARDGAV
ncbi:MAG: thiol-activated cytolysin family protein, partial [Porphyromonadaceae bacterium]|nr:thiol-activated cytolysin family protein [Porphyromonadaceae bacterium]